MGLHSDPETVIQLCIEVLIFFWLSSVFVCLSVCSSVSECVYVGVYQYLTLSVGMCVCLNVGGCESVCVYKVLRHILISKSKPDVIFLRGSTDSQPVEENFEKMMNRLRLLSLE